MKYFLGASMKKTKKPLRAYEKEYKKWVIGCPNCPQFYKSTKVLSKWVKCNMCGYKEKNETMQKM